LIGSANAGRPERIVMVSLALSGALGPLFLRGQVVVVMITFPSPWVVPTGKLPLSEKGLI
jgi:hypothetical protein